MASIVKGNEGPVRTWSGTRDAEGQRAFKALYRLTYDGNVGPTVVMDFAGGPGVGTSWNVDGDTDIWAFRTLATTVNPVIKDGNDSKVWDVVYNFSTKQPERCQDQQVEDPLSEPQKISGSFVKYTEEIEKDKDGNVIETSSHELIRGPIVEFDNNRPTVIIEQNVASLQLDVFSNMVDTVNDAELWGLGARKIKLSNVSWSRELYALCYFYYTRRFEFDINFDTFDRETKDQGLMVLRGHWEDGVAGWILDGAPNAADARDFIRFKDRNKENARVFLDGAGQPAANAAAAADISIAFYTESNFLELNIPTTL